MRLTCRQSSIPSTSTTTAWSSGTIPISIRTWSMRPRSAPTSPTSRSISDAGKSRSIEACADALFLHRAGHRRDVVLDEEGVEHDQRQRAHQRARHQRAPAIDVAVDELVDDRDRHRLVLGGGDESERIDEL